MMHIVTVAGTDERPPYRTQPTRTIEVHTGNAAAYKRFNALLQQATQPADTMFVFYSQGAYIGWLKRKQARRAVAALRLYARLHKLHTGLKGGGNGYEA